jgi:hypothetical protein
MPAIGQMVGAQKERRNLVVDRIGNGCYLRLYSHGALVWEYAWVLS